MIALLNRHRTALFAVTLIASTSASYGVILTIGPTLADAGGLPSYPNQTGVLNEAIFTVDETGAGTGTFNTFLAVQAPGNATIAQGHNSGVTPVNDEKSGAAQISEMQLSSVPINALDPSIDYIGQTYTAGDYFEIRLDQNRNKASGSTPISTFTEMQFWVSETPITTHYDGSINGNPADWEALNPGVNDSGLGTLVWDLDGNGDNTLQVGVSNAGSGSSDAILFIPVQAFLDAAPGATADWYLTMWVNVTEMNSGFDEFNKLDEGSTGVGFLPPGSPVPESSQFALFFGTLAFMMTTLRRRLNRA